MLNIGWVGRRERSASYLPLLVRKCDWPNFSNLAAPAFIDLLLKLTWMLGFSTNKNEGRAFFKKESPKGKASVNKQFAFSLLPLQRGVSPIPLNIQPFYFCHYWAKGSGREFRGVLSIATGTNLFQPWLTRFFSVRPFPLSTASKEQDSNLLEPKGSVVGACWRVWEKRKRSKLQSLHFTFGTSKFLRHGKVLVFKFYF